MTSITTIAAETAASHPYTCNTCQVAYRSTSLQKAHMKSDWHRYNLKRRVASLPPITAEVFTEKVLQARAESSAAADKAYFERTCNACNKTYSSQNAYQNHLSSQKHKQNEVAAEDRPEDENHSVTSSTFSLGEPLPTTGNSLDSEAVDIDLEEENEKLETQRLTGRKYPPIDQLPDHPPSSGSISKTGDSETVADGESSLPVSVQPVVDPTWTIHSCIFCNYESSTTALNAHHMERLHGMFIPEKPYLVDLDGLIKHLQCQVLEDHECLFCGKIKATAQAVQTHMKDTGHCKIPFTTEDEQLEIGEYYDFRSTYSDGDEDETSSESGSVREKNGGAKLGSRRTVQVQSNGEDVEDEDGNGWETDSSVSSLDSEDLTAVPAEGHIHQFERLSKHKHHSRHDPRQRHQADGWHSHAHRHSYAVFYDDCELHLPSGKAIGHRSLNRYYRQNLNHYPTPQERAERQLIEAASSAEGETGRESALQRGRHDIQAIPRGAIGLADLSAQQKDKVRKSEKEARSLETVHTKRNDLSYSQKLNRYKTYYYRYQKGG